MSDRRRLNKGEKRQAQEGGKGETPEARRQRLQQMAASRKRARGG